LELVTIYITADPKTRLDRMLNRKDDFEKIAGRITNDIEKFKNIEYDYSVVNKDLEKTVKVIDKIMEIELMSGGENYEQ
jgi:guanylate kinase